MNRISNDTGGGTLKISTSSSSFRPPFLYLSPDKHRLPEMKMQRVQTWLAHLPANPDEFVPPVSSVGQPPRPNSPSPPLSALPHKRELQEPGCKGDNSTAGAVGMKCDDGGVKIDSKGKPSGSSSSSSSSSSGQGWGFVSEDEKEYDGGDESSEMNDFTSSWGMFWFLRGWQGWVVGRWR